MIKLRNLSISQKLRLILIAVSAGAVYFSCLVFYLGLDSHYRQTYRGDLASLAKILSHNCEAALSFDVPEDARNVLESLRNRASIVSATIRDRQGQVFATYSGAALAAPAPALLVVSQDIFLGEASIGQLILEDDMAHVRAMRHTAILILLAVSGVATIAIIFLASWLQGYISQPILELAAISQRVSEEEDYTVQASKRCDDEVGQLVIAFNEMLRQINKRDLAVRGSEKRFRSLISQAVDSFFLLDGEGQLLDVNQQACDTLGYCREELLGLRLRALLAQPEAEEHFVAFAAGAQPAQPVTVEVEFRRRDGTLLPVEIRLGWLELEERQYIMALVRDISARRQAEEEKASLEARLLQSQKMESIGTLAGGIAHDFNNILTAIMGYTELAAYEAEKGTPLAAKLQEVLKASRRAAELVRQILAFSRQQPQEKAPLELQPIIKESLKLIRASIPATIKIEPRLTANCGLVFANPTQIHQVLMNLCTNAAHAMHRSGGVMTIALEQWQISANPPPEQGELHLPPGNYLRLRVSDTGQGMEPSTMQRIFEPYFTTKKVGEGTGMGLAVVHGIVTGLGGQILVESRLGAGTEFAVYLPRSEAAPPQGGEQGARALARGRERILLVDDEAAIIAMEEELLLKLGYVVSSFQKPTEAWARFQQSPSAFDLLITDMTMPDMTGVQLAQRVLALRPELPIILCTGYSEAIDEAGARRMGIREYVAKPIAFQEFGETLRRALASGERG